MLTGAAIAVVVLVAVLWLDTALTAAVFGIVWLIGASEWGALIGLATPGRTAFAAAFAAFFASVIGFGLTAQLAAAWLGVAAVGWLLAFVCVLRFPAGLPRPVLIGSGLVFLSAAWLALYWLHGAGSRGPSLVIAGLFIVWSADIGAFFVGRSLGHKLLAPRVSPKKTWEGVAGGVAFAVATGLAAAAWLGLPYGVLAPLAAVVALVSVVGDLSVSMLKRWAHQKDSGMLLPGHGGILDRFDGVTAGLPFFVLGLQFAHVLD